MTSPDGRYKAYGRSAGDADKPYSLAFLQNIGEETSPVVVAMPLMRSSNYPQARPVAITNTDLYFHLQAEALLYKMDLRSGEFENIDTGVFDVHESPDKSKIAYISNWIHPVSSLQVNAIALADGSKIYTQFATTLNDASVETPDMQWSADSSIVYYCDPYNGRNKGLWAMSLLGNRKTNKVCDECSSLALQSMGEIKVAGEDLCTAAKASPETTSNSPSPDAHKPEPDTTRSGLYEGTWEDSKKGKRNFTLYLKEQGGRFRGVGTVESWTCWEVYEGDVHEDEIGLSGVDVVENKKPKDKYVLDSLTLQGDGAASLTGTWKDKEGSSGAISLTKKRELEPTDKFMDVLNAGSQPDSSTGSAPAAESASYKIAINGIGPVRLGMSLDEMEKSWEGGFHGDRNRYGTSDCFFLSLSLPPSFDRQWANLRCTMAVVQWPPSRNFSTLSVGWQLPRVVAPCGAV
ncbi:MAG: hypothetical protein HC888_04245 [Candidatus Competibacteraceae bacterium]|nr:hypothetical protein [Candidatus Competibacteraceae bacterium]